MQVKLHANATPTPKMRKYIQESDKPVSVLAVSESTIRSWRDRDCVQDRFHTAHNLQTTMIQVQELLVVELRKFLLFSLDDLLVVTREFINPAVSRSALDRCLCRYGINRLKDLISDTEPVPSLKSFRHTTRVTCTSM